METIIAMRRKPKRFIYLLRLMSLLIVLSFASCAPQVVGCGDEEPLSYATLLSMIHKDGYTLCILRNPWDTTKIFHRYVFVERGIETDSLPGGTIVHVPIQRAAVFTSVHCSLLKMFDKTNSIYGICDADYVTDEWLKRTVAEGGVKDYGSSMNPNVESIVASNLDAVMVSPFEGSGGYGRLETIGVPIIECVDYMEKSPLARAEWMKFYGELFGCRSLADSLFNIVENRYDALRIVASEAKSRPVVVSELPMTDGTWYVPGGNSTMGMIYSDAGANYFLKDDNRSGSVPLSPEVVLTKAGDADIWLIKQSSNMDYESVGKVNPICMQMRAFKNKNIYFCNTMTSSFYEETPFRPDLLLDNLIAIFHPELKNGKCYREYFQKIN